MPQFCGRGHLSDETPNRGGQKAVVRKELTALVAKSKGFPSGVPTWFSQSGPLVIPHCNWLIHPFSHSSPQAGVWWAFWCKMAAMHHTGGCYSVRSPFCWYLDYGCDSLHGIDLVCLFVVFGTPRENLNKLTIVLYTVKSCQVTKVKNVTVTWSWIIKFIHIIQWGGLSNDKIFKSWLISQIM